MRLPDYPPFVQIHGRITILAHVPIKTPPMRSMRSRFGGGNVRETRASFGDIGLSSPPILIDSGSSPSVARVKRMQTRGGNLLGDLIPGFRPFNLGAGRLMPSL